MYLVTFQRCKEDLYAFVTPCLLTTCHIKSLTAQR